MASHFANPYSVKQFNKILIFLPEHLIKYND